MSTNTSSTNTSANTIAINRRMNHFDGHAQVWLFGYGSLIYKADFAYLERRPARIHGWSRRFWQGSHDHRGTPDAPGRVVTLIAEPGACCAGMAYLITPQVFDHLDRREKNGYLRHATIIELIGGDSVQGLVYIAPAGNTAWLGPAPDADIANQISHAAGPSGSNRDYLQHLVRALRELGEHDAHVCAIDACLHAIDGHSVSRPGILHGEYKIPGGKLVVVDLEIDAGRLARVQLSGDFFLEPDSALDTINAALAGLAADADDVTIAAAIRIALGPGVSLYGLSAEGIATAVRRALGQGNPA